MFKFDQLTVSMVTYWLRNVPVYNRASLSGLSRVDWVRVRVDSCESEWILACKLRIQARSLLLLQPSNLALFEGVEPAPSDESSVPNDGWTGGTGLFCSRAVQKVSTIEQTNSCSMTVTHTGMRQTTHQMPVQNEDWTSVLQDLFRLGERTTRAATDRLEWDVLFFVWDAQQVQNNFAT